jgi:hypothetical protein
VSLVVGVEVILGAGTVGADEVVAGGEFVLGGEVAVEGAVETSQNFHQNVSSIETCFLLRPPDSLYCSSLLFFRTTWGERYSYP